MRSDDLVISIDGKSKAVSLKGVFVFEYIIFLGIPKYETSIII